jgi:hypothetical protein
MTRTYTYENLEISGYQDRPLPNTFLRQKRETDHLALLYPGVGYTAHMPLLYYPSLALTELRADVLRVETVYIKRSEYIELPAPERARWLFDDATAACRGALAQRAYQKLTLVGKSLGTLAMGSLLTAELELPQTEAIWLTPLLWNNTLRSQVQQARPRSLFAVGTADTHYSASYLAELEQATGGTSVVVDGGNHSLEIDGNLTASLEALERLVQAVQSFLAGG